MTIAARREGEARRSGRAARSASTASPAGSSALPPLPPARRGELADGGVARQGDGRAHLPRLQRRAPPRDAAAVHDRRQDHPRRRAAPLRRAARVSRHGQAGGPRRRRRPPGAEGDSRPARAAPRHRARLPELQPPLGHAVRRRVAAHPAVDADRLGPDGHALRARRAEHRPAPEGQRQDDRDARAACATSATPSSSSSTTRTRSAPPITSSRWGPGPACTAAASSCRGRSTTCSKCKASPTGQFLSGQAVDRDAEAAPERERQGARRARRAREQPQVDRRRRSRSASSSRSPARPARARARWSTRFSTRRCGSAWSTRARCPASTIASTGVEHVHKVVNIDQSPIGRNSRSNPATYIGFYDTIRDLFTQAPLSIERGYKPGRFSFNVKGGRCEECQGEGAITTQLYFMPDVEVTCGACKGARFNSETLEVTLRGKTIDDVLNMSVEEGVTFFAQRAGGPSRKIEVLARSRARLPHARPVGDDAVGRRGAARQDRDRAEHAAALEAHGLHPRRADDRPAPGRRRAAARIAEPAGRRRAHGAADRASPRRDQDRRSRDRPRAGGRARRRGSRRDGDAGRGRGVQGVAHRAVPQVASPGEVARGADEESEGNHGSQAATEARPLRSRSAPWDSPCPASRKARCSGRQRSECGAGCSRVSRPTSRRSQTRWWCASTSTAGMN